MLLSSDFWIIANYFFIGMAAITTFICLIAFAISKKPKKEKIQFALILGLLLAACLIIQGLFFTHGKKEDDAPISLLATATLIYIGTDMSGRLLIKPSNKKEINDGSF